MDSTPPAVAAWQRGYRSNRFLDMVRSKVHFKQKWFLSITELELLYGGAAGGGKSDSMLMGALQYVDIPGYAAILFRKTYADLSLEGALMDRASKWLTGLPGVYKKDGGKKWAFENGGSLSFGYLDNESDKYRYQSAEFQYIGFDELTQFPMEAYSYLFSRLRKPAPGPCGACNGRGSHRKELCQKCLGTGRNLLAEVPLRMRAASNPGGTHGEWVLNSFIPRTYLKADAETQFSRVWAKQGPCTTCGGSGKVTFHDALQGDVTSECRTCLGQGKARRYFVPARLEDNPSLDMFEYNQSLSRLPYVTRMQLRSGVWDVAAAGLLFQREWFRSYTMRDRILILKTPGGRKVIDSTKWWVCLTADTASTTKSTSDYTVICAWAITEPEYDICLLGVFRQKILIPKILPTIKRISNAYNSRFTIIEEASSGIAIIQEARLNSSGLIIVPYSPHTGDKVSRSTEAQLLAENGRIYLPESENETIDACINELIQFPDSEHDDFVDNMSQIGWWIAHKSRLMNMVTKGSMLHPPMSPITSPLRRS